MIPDPSWLPQGRPKGEDKAEDKKKYSLQPVLGRLSEALGKPVRPDNSLLASTLLSAALAWKDARPHLSPGSIMT
jgi:3-phosphoglycerate kinase